MPDNVDNKSAPPMLTYDNSPSPAKTPGGPAVERIPDRGIGVDEKSGKLTYESASAEGMIELELPSLPGSPRETETLHARDFGQHVIGKIQASLDRQGYLTTGATAGPAEVFRHYCSVAKGATLLDKATQRRMEQLAEEFEGELDQGEFFRQMAKPWLGSLSPGKR
jgi:hypothetical protein